MKKSEYDKKFCDIRKKAEQAEKKLNIEFALSNSPYKIGDVIKDSNLKIRITRIDYYYGACYPACKYAGILLKNDGTPFKNKREGVIYQPNIIKD